MNGNNERNIPKTSHMNDYVHWYMSELSHRVVAQSGVPADRHHLGKLILQSLKDAPEFILQIDGATGESDNFGSILKRSVQCANGLRKLGAKTGDVMILMAPNHLDLAVPLYAALYLGLIIAPIDKDLKISELQDTFLVDRPKVIFCHNERLPDVMEAVSGTGVSAEIITFDKGDKVFSLADLQEKHGNDVRVDDFRPSEFDPATAISFLISTSGTTGKPKAAAISHKSAVLSFPNLWLNYTTFPTPTKLALIVSPLQWATAIMHYALAPILRYTKLQSSLPMTQEHAHYVINRYRPTYAIISPTLLTSLIKSEGKGTCDFTSFETLIVGGGAVHRGLVADMKELTPKTAVYIGYGMSESAGMVFQHNSSPPGSCGTRMASFQYRLIDPMTGEEIHEPHLPGELHFHSPAMFTNYFNNPEATKETFDGCWFKTGDIFYRDENWNFFFVDRLKQLLKYRNHQISPVEVEGVIRQHGGVLDVAVVGVPDAECGDLPVAAVVRKPGAAVTAGDIKNLVKENLTDTKQLRGGVVFMSELPTTATTKLHRRKLQEIVLTANRE